MAHERDLRAQLQSASLHGDELEIQKIVGVDRISGLFSYTIEALRRPDAPIDEDALMLQPAWIDFSTGDEHVHTVYGMIWKIRELAEHQAVAPRVEITLVPRAHAATMREMLDIFMDVTVPEIVEACLTRCGLQAGEHFELGGLQDNYRKKEFVVQYKETDFAFISRLCEHHGIFFFVDHSSGKDVLTFGDRNTIFPSSERTPELPFRPVESTGGELFEHIQSVDMTRNALPKRYTVRDYNYRIPGVDLMSSADVDPNGLGEIIEYGAHFKDPDEGQWFAQIRAQELAASQRVFTLHGNAIAICAGQKFLLLEHPSGDIDLLVTSVTHTLEQTDEAARTTITAIPSEVAYRPPRVTPKPRVNGIITGIIDAGVKDGYADIDEQGRYRVRFMFDTAGRGEGQASRLVRMAQPHAGEGYGMHFPLRPGTEVILSCIDGDPDRPIITGTVPNPSTASPVAAGNRDRNVSRSGGGNEMEMSDEKGAERVKISSPHANTVLQLGAPFVPEAGAIISTTGNMVSQVAGTVGTMADFASTINSARGDITGKSVTSVAGVPDPIKGFEAVEKLAKSGLNAAKSLLATVDKVSSFGDDVMKETKKRVEAEATEEFRAELKRKGLKYPDDALRAKIDSGDGRTIEIVETQAQFEERLRFGGSGTPDRKPANGQASPAGNGGETNPLTASASTGGAIDTGPSSLVDDLIDNAASTLARASSLDALPELDSRPMLDAISEITGLPRFPDINAKTAREALRAANEQIDTIKLDDLKTLKEGGEAFLKSAKSAKKALFSSKHKAIQDAMGKIAKASATSTAGLATAASEGSLGRRAAKVRSPGAHYNLITATDSVVAEGLQAFYGMSPLKSYIFGGNTAMVVSGSKLALHSVIRAELAAPVTMVTSTHFDLLARKTIGIKSLRSTTIAVGEKLKVTSEDDTSVESKKRFFVTSKDLLEVDGGDEARMTAKKWSVEASEGDYEMKTKADYRLASEGLIELKHDKTRLFIVDETALLETSYGGSFITGADVAASRVNGGSSVEVRKSEVKVEAKSKFELTASTINIKGKVLLG